ncbi:MAG: 3-oxoacyl-ACP reductase FabG [Rhodocyclaceae bacterium]|jgi:3-oxoacyl-[acyl-carrier protein] reductase|nr:3-oxoacyl-ACP reductase FabG [Rhodocyclaceae bacterium]MCE2723043.1 3-oxoacyl-ACP reductase FabG [Betaproteobacteria bacterium]MCA3018950.1 3-oxoacyl-ACP reductase FabG [Rhodocyclaceae bacterium]MCA3021012.1 3-oxoacyl-ACP reductase FabG [Rhodocyclaceae bacterium]MCA3025408.1 3-oxoacyl-ACP reductase FabG [Rhodocyclaceae bacterium]
MTKLLDGQVALVTGATRGIGAAILGRLLAEGATVIGTATSDSGAATIQAAIDAAGGKGLGAVLDVKDAAQTDSLLKTLEENFGAVSILVNNAGITRDNLMMRMKDEDWSGVLETNLTSVFRLCRGVIKGMMKARAGRIINIASVVGFMGNAGQVNYVAAKAGMVGFSKALAREVGSRNITVNCVAPGFIETDMTKALSAEQVSKLVGSVPLGRLGQPADIAEAVLFLASSRAAYITGNTIHVNGGMHME